MVGKAMYLTTLLSLQTFLTLSLQDMASRVQLSGPQEAEKYVLHMVSQHDRRSKGMLYFGTPKITHF